MQKKIEPFNDITEKAYQLTGKPRKSALEHGAFHYPPWGTIHNKALMSRQDSVRQSVTLAFPKESSTICGVTDISEGFRASIVTQTKEEHLQQKGYNQKLAPTAFLGGKFVKVQRNWTTYEKEAYAIVQTFERMAYLFSGAQPVHVFTDHGNLLYVFAPPALRSNPLIDLLSKVHCWAVHYHDLSS